MSFVSFEPGSITLGSGDTTADFTIPTTVTISNTIIWPRGMIGGGTANNQTNVRLTLIDGGSGTSTTVRATRTTSGTAITLRFDVHEDTSFFVQHFSPTAASGTVSQSITSVDLSRSWIVGLGASGGGTSRNQTSTASAKLTSSTNVDIIALSTPVISFQVVQMDAALINSVQFIEPTSAYDTAITAVDINKTLIFATLNHGFGTTVLNANRSPVYSLPSTTLLQIDLTTASTFLSHRIYIVEFTNLVTEHFFATSVTGLTVTETLGAAPTYGTCLINGHHGTFACSNIADDLTTEYAFVAEQTSPGAWELSRSANTVTTNFLSYTCVDWDTLHAAGGAVAKAQGLQNLSSQFAAVSATRLGGVLQ